LAKPFTQNEIIRERLAAESGTLFKRGGLRVALVYPSPYTVGMSSLGFQTIYRIINQDSDHSAERAFLLEKSAGKEPLLAYETGDPVGDFDVVAFSLSYELEITGVIDCLERSGLKPFAVDRSPSDPPVIIGGPLTFSNPIPAAPFADMVVMGEGETLMLNFLEAYSKHGSKSRVVEELADQQGVYVPSLHGERLVPIAQVDDAMLPAYSQIITPNTELRNMHLVEAERGCHRRCTFCVMRRSTNGGMRTAPVDRILATIPEHAERVGLVGAAVTDHPQLLEIVEGIVGAGRGIGVSSLRADRLTPELVGLLAKGGYRTLTVASDGATERLRRLMQKSIKAHHLRHAAKMAAQFRMRFLKVYMMLGAPTEEDEDLDELIEFSRELAGIAPIAMTLSPFVAKRNTPLDGAGFAGVDVVERRIKRLKKGLKGAVDLRSTSARWAWIEYCCAQGGFEMAKAAQLARAGGGNFRAWKDAIQEHAPQFIDSFRAKSTSKVRPRLGLEGSQP